ncbi:MAG: hypothetical protein ACRDQ1_13325, partial [Sciscionella sp.]
MREQGNQPEHVDASSTGERPGTALNTLLIALGDPLVELLAAPAGLLVAVRDVSIADPEDAPDARPHDLALLIFFSHGI